MTIRALWYRLILGSPRLHSLWYRLWRKHYDRYMIGKSFLDEQERYFLYGDGSSEPLGIMHAKAETTPL
jgi:hypothetical protein